MFDKLGDALGAVGAVKIYIATNVPVDGYVYGALVLRVHSCTQLTGSPTVSLAAVQSAPTAEDPGLTFRGAVLIDGSTNGKVTLSSGMAPTIAVVGQNMGFNGTFSAGSQFVDIQLIVVQGATANSPMAFTVSADLVLRS